jgi:hypothetical protein
MKLGTFVFKSAISSCSNNLVVSTQDQRSMSSIQPSVDIFCQIDGAYKQPAKEEEEHDIEEFEEQK